jgi:hypothetical protein
MQAQAAARPFCQLLLDSCQVPLDKSTPHAKPKNRKSLKNQVSFILARLVWRMHSSGWLNERNEPIGENVWQQKQKQKQ